MRERVIHNNFNATMHRTISTDWMLSRHRIKGVRHLAAPRGLRCRTVVFVSRLAPVAGQERAQEPIVEHLSGVRADLALVAIGGQVVGDTVGDFVGEAVDDALDIAGEIFNHGEVPSEPARTNL